MFIQLNLNPKKKHVGDCTVRAIALATNRTWDEAYLKLAIQGFMSCDMPSSNSVWGDLLKHEGFKCYVVDPIITVKEFCNKHPEDVYVLATGEHVLVAAHGDYYDTWDSGDESLIYCWRKDEF